MEFLQEKSFTFKIILAGPHNSGKTMFLWKWNKGKGEFIGNPTIGADFIRKDFNEKFKIHMWDTAGQETYQSITAPYFRSCNGVLLVFDLTDRGSFGKLNYWLELIRDNTKEMPIIFLVGNKNDMHEQCINDAEINAFCRDQNLSFYRTSAMTGEGVDDVVIKLIELMVTENKVKREPLQTAAVKTREERSKNCC